MVGHVIMPTGSIVVIVLMVLALGVIAFLWTRTNRRPAKPRTATSARQSQASIPDAPKARPPAPSQPQVSHPSIPDQGTALDKDRESDPEITMMGRVPDEVLAMMRGKLSADIEIEVEEEAVDIDVEELVDEMAEEENTGAHALILVVGVARSDRGKHRLCNEDAFLVLEDHHLFVVADGMGGHNAGEVASQHAVDVMESCFRENSFPGVPRPEWPRRGDELVRSIHHANRQVYELSQQKDDYKGMGTTVVAVRFSPNKQRAYIAHVGDSRCYRVRGDELHQLTEDHTLGRLMGAKGKAARHLAQAVGVRPDVAVDLTVDEPQPGDYYLVCSDGLTKMVPDDQILDIALRDEDIEQRCRALVDEANARGGRDNITAIIIRVENPIKFAQRISEAEV